MAIFSYQIEVDIYKDHMTPERITQLGYNVKLSDWRTEIIDVSVVSDDWSGNENALDDEAIDLAKAAVGWTFDGTVIIKDLWILGVDQDGENVYTIE